MLASALRRRVLILGLAATGLLGLSEPVTAEAVCGAGSNSFVPGDTRVAQTFVPDPAYAGITLRGGGLKVVKPAGTTGDWVVQLLAVDGAGNPTNTALRSVTVDDATVPEGVFYDLNGKWTPDYVWTGVVAIAVTRPTASDFYYVYCDTNHIPEGRAFTSSSQTGSWSPKSAGIDLIPNYSLGGCASTCPFLPPPVSTPRAPIVPGGSGESGCEAARERVRKAKKKLKEADTPEKKQRAREKLKKAKQRMRAECA